MRQAIISIGFVALAMSAIAPAQSPAAPPEDLAVAMKRCAAFKNEKDRHACTDDAMIAAGLMEAPKASDKRYRFGLPILGERKAKQPKEAKAKPEPRYTPRYVEPDMPDSIQVTLRSVVDRGDGKLMLLTTDGAVWRQTESGEIRPFPQDGQTMTIERAAMGGYLCKTSRYKSFRCHRPGLRD